MVTEDSGPRPIRAAAMPITITIMMIIKNFFIVQRIIFKRVERNAKVFFCISERALKKRVNTLYLFAANAASIFCLKVANGWAPTTISPFTKNDGVPETPYAEPAS